MSTSVNKLLFNIARQRITVSRIFGVLVLLLILFTTPSFSRDSLTDTVLGMSGLFLLTICSVGRLWALLYISGYKKLELITEGPYSMVRHPLYVFSLIGAIGIGLASKNILVLAALVIFYLLYYPLTIIVEERKLVDKFDQGYLDYIKRTPRFLPKLSLYKGNVQYQINADVYVKKMIFGMWFIWIYIILNIIEILQQSGHIPVFLRVP
ncbi:MAG: isoprenylcysteine carboxylmethyltransferase family protein [Phycisphaerae bacterium]|nr:isoprenylcysteine carboxylmethyltransferase family protein [Phycisphaerae bacterium]